MCKPELLIVLFLGLNGRGGYRIFERGGGGRARVTVKYENAAHLCLFPLYEVWGCPKGGGGGGGPDP